MKQKDKIGLLIPPAKQKVEGDRDAQSGFQIIRQHPKWGVYFSSATTTILIFRRSEDGRVGKDF